MLAELMIANAAFAVIKQTLSNGKDIADAGSAVTKYFSASQSIHQKVKLGTGDVLAAYQAKQAIERQEKELAWMLNKQEIQGYYKDQQFREEFYKKQKADAKKQKAQAKEIKDTLVLAGQVIGILITILAAFFGVVMYLKY